MRVCHCDKLYGIEHSADSVRRDMGGSDRLAYRVSGKKSGFVFLWYQFGGGVGAQ